MRPKIAMWSDYGFPTQKRWRSRYQRSTRTSTGLKILLVAITCVAGVIGISGVYPQIIDSEWARGMSAHSQGIARSETAPESVRMTLDPQPISPARPGLGRATHRRQFGNGGVVPFSSDARQASICAGGLRACPSSNDY
jgi:hypothetical protein